MVTRLEAHIRGRALRARQGPLERDDLGMRPPEDLMISLRHDLATLYQNAAHHRIRMYLPPPFVRDPARQLQVHPID